MDSLSISALSIMRMWRTPCIRLMSLILTGSFFRLLYAACRAALSGYFRGRPRRFGVAAICILPVGSGEVSHTCFMVMLPSFGGDVENAQAGGHCESSLKPAPNQTASDAQGCRQGWDLDNGDGISPGPTMGSGGDASRVLREGLNLLAVFRLMEMH